MEEEWLVTMSTGGVVEGIFSTLENAKAAVERHYKLILGEQKDRSAEMIWWPTGDGLWEWRMYQEVKPDYPNLPRNCTPDGVLESIQVRRFYKDEPLEVV